jgi:hypothetical protein
MIHDSVKSNSIFFGEPQRIQITDFGLIQLEMDEPECVIESGVSLGG